MYAPTAMTLPAAEGMVKVVSGFRACPLGSQRSKLPVTIFRGTSRKVQIPLSSTPSRGRNSK